MNREVERAILHFAEQDRECVLSSKCRSFGCPSIGLPPDGFCADHASPESRTTGNRGMWLWVNTVGSFEDAPET